jgi:hypothetical protein
MCRRNYLRQNAFFRVFEAIIYRNLYENALLRETDEGKTGQVIEKMRGNGVLEEKTGRFTSHPSRRTTAR